jgi:hypothetical protein
MLVNENETVEGMVYKLEKALVFSSPNDNLEDNEGISNRVLSIRINEPDGLQMSVGTGLMITSNGFFSTAGHVATFINRKYHKILDGIPGYRLKLTQKILDELTNIAKVVTPNGVEYKVDPGFCELHPKTDLALLKAITQVEVERPILPILISDATLGQRVTMVAEGSRNKIIHPQKLPLYTETGYILKTAVDDSVEEVIERASAKPYEPIKITTHHVQYGIGTSVKSKPGDSGAPFISELSELVGQVAIAQTEPPINPATTLWSTGTTGGNLYDLLQRAVYNLKTSRNRIATTNDS